ncbi:MAG: fused MFS/spermidine synthase, partial [Acidobacteria bacterium]|nr:fused MFS/spermidine synthase [Acidobacteriota bacterium]
MYAALEFAVAAMAGSLTILVWPQATRWSSFAWRLAGDSVTGLLVARLGVAAVFLLLPAALMGGTFPVLARYRPPLRSRDSWVPALYTANTLGAVAGAVGSGFLLLPLVGAARTAAAAMSLNAVAAMMALGLARSASAGSTPDSKESDETRSRAPAVRRRSPWRIWLLLLLAGAVTLAFEVIWTRALTLVLGSSTYAFATMLATYIGGLALGALVATRLVSSFRQDVPCLIWVQLGSALGALIALHLVPTLPVAFLYMFRLTGDHPVALTVGMSALAVGIMFPTAVSQGMVFPIGVHAVTGGHPDLGGRAGLAYAVSTCGAVLGALITTFWLIPALGIDHAGGAAAAVSLCAAGLAVSDGEEHRIRVAGGVAIAACALALSMFFPTWDTLRLGAGIYRDAPRLLQLYPSPREFPRIFRHYRPVLHRDGAGASVLVYDRPSLASLPHRVLVIDGKVEASTADDMSTQVLSGHLPLMVGGPSGRALVIGVASGITLGALAQHPFRDIVAAEIEPAVLDAARTFRDFNHDALSDPRVHVVLDDGRHYLAAVTDPFDVIVSEPSNPWIPGSARLFTLEFFQQVRAHLQDGGVFAQWIQLYGLEPNLLRALVRTFQSIFPEVLVVQASDGDLLLLGAARPLRLDYARTAELLTHRQVADDLSRIGIHNPAEIAVRLVLGGADVKTYAGSGVLNTDDNALLEFAASRTLYRDTITANAEALAVHAPTVPMSYIQRLGETADARAQAGRAVSRAYLGGERGTAARRAAEWSQMEAPTADGWWLLGQAASQLGDAAEAGRAWRRALALDPQHADARLALARLAWRRGDLFESGAVLGPLLLHWDTAPAAALYLRGLLTARGDAPR